MLHQKIIFSLICTVSILPHSIQSSADNKTQEISDFLKEWDKLEQQQRCLSRTTNFCSSCLRDTTRFLCASFVSNLATQHIYPYVTQEKPGNPIPLQCILCCWYARQVQQTYRQECVTKPKAHIVQQNLISSAIRQRYSISEIKQATGLKHPLFRPADNHPKMQ